MSKGEVGMSKETAKDITRWNEMGVTILDKKIREISLEGGFQEDFNAERD